MGFDITRPFRWGWAGVKGLVGGTLDGGANWGRKGFWIGIGAGAIVGILTGGLGYLFMGAVAGLVAGAGAGAVLGGITGGVGNVARERRREKYADEVAERQELSAARQSRQSSAPSYTPGYREGSSVRQSTANYNFERALQQERENDRDYSTYWQDRVERGHGGNGRGF